MKDLADRFKFRVWLVEAKRYRDLKNRDDRETWFNLLPDGEVVWGCCDDVGDPDEMPEVLIEQCTGLKDENGKLIFEGDILKVEDPNGDEIPSIPVQWDDNACTYPVEVGIFTDFDVTSVGWAQQMENRFTVIGNIHENPELLTEKEKGQ